MTHPGLACPRLDAKRAFLGVESRIAGADNPHLTAITGTVRAESLLAAGGFATVDP